MKKLFKEQKFIVLIVAIVLYVIFALLSKEFRRYTTIIQMLDFAYYVVLMAIGVTFPLITGGVDLSIGTGMICYALVGGFMIRNYHWPVVLAMLLSVLFGLVIGILNGTLVSVMGLPPFLATLCTCMITRGLGTLLVNKQAVPWPTNKVPEGWFHSIFKLTIGRATKIPTGLIPIAIIVIIMMFVLNHTRVGRYTIAIGSNREATRLSGVNVRIYHIAAYAICGLFAGLASIAYAAATPTVQPGTGAGLELDAIGAAIVGGVSAAGGVGSIEGTVIGVLFIQILKIGLPFIGLEANWQQIILGLILIGAVLVDVIKKRKEAAL
ncbi:MAG: ABC transporter permease [Lachnospiraceae bacterium]|nr:ABC transporter permease [Lachnospiraceae bacterium]